MALAGRDHVSTASTRRVGHLDILSKNPNCGSDRNTNTRITIIEIGRIAKRTQWEARLS